MSVLLSSGKGQFMNKPNNSIPLRVNNITKRFYQGQKIIEAVKKVNLIVEKGDFIAIMGPSGSGKSTLLHLIAGLTNPDEGSIEVNGKDIFTMSDSQLTKFRRKHIGLVFQAYNLIPTLTAKDNISLPIILDSRLSNIEKQLLGLLKDLEIDHLQSQRPDTMSGGEQQRVAIARALITNPSIILADEPTGNLDSINGQRICKILRTLCDSQTRTIVMVTHEAQVAIWAKKIVIMKDGQLIDSINTSEIKDFDSLVDFYQSRLAGTASLQ